jgi:hypothetical protein
VCDSIGIFITIPGQAAAGIALMTVSLPWTLPRVVVLVAGLIVVYVVTGGAISAGVAGFVKLLIAFAALLVLGAVALSLAGGTRPMHVALASKYFSLFGNGLWKDLGNGLGIVFGVHIYEARTLSRPRIRCKRRPPVCNPAKVGLGLVAGAILWCSCRMGVLRVRLRHVL